MVWPEVEQALKQNRYELVLHGDKLRVYFEENKSIDENIWKLEKLNFLELSESKVIEEIPQQIQRLTNLITLTLSGNRIERLGNQLDSLVNLRHLNLSNNCLEEMNEKCFSGLHLLETLNLSMNKLNRIDLSSLKDKSKLSSLNLSKNELEQVETLPDKLDSLSNIDLSSNRLKLFPSSVFTLTALKTIDLQSNLIETIPGGINNLTKLKEIRLNSNPLKDNRLKKLVEQNKMKQVIEYVGRPSSLAESTCPSSSTDERRAASTPDDQHRIEIVHFSDDRQRSIQVVVDESIDAVRPHFIGFLLENVELNTEGNIKKFLKIQNEIHESICEKRTLASLGTHDLDKIKGNLTFTSRDPNEIRFNPLGKHLKEQTAKQFYLDLCREAEQERKIRKRNQLSGIYKFLSLVEGQQRFSCLHDDEGLVLSVAPLSNSEETKLTDSSSRVFVEISSDKSIEVCRRVSEAFIRRIFEQGLAKPDHFNPGQSRTLRIKQVRVVRQDKSLKLVFPSRNDLLFDKNCSIRVERNER